jgi:hypothetical protein
MNQIVLTVAAALALLALAACDQRIAQTIIVRANIENASANSLWLVEANECASTRIEPGWYRDGLWIFRLSSTRGGVGAVTQELALCVDGVTAPPKKTWHSVHGGGAPLLVISCINGEPDGCRMYQDGYTEGAWSDDA